jgi:hypothetical protein
LEIVVHESLLYAQRRGSPGAEFIGDPVQPLVERSRYRGEKFENGVNSFLCVPNSGHPK